MPALLRELAWVVHRQAPDRAGIGPMPTTELMLLKQVIDYPDSTVNELATVLGLRQPNVSSALRVLEQRGYISREKSDSDRRVSHIRATQDGNLMHEAISEAWANDIAVALEALPGADRDALQRAAPALLNLQLTLRRSSSHGSGRS